ncbi:hypothetical protein J5277_20965 [Rhizobium sp. 16-449-1b]|uniref:hypothetical protein n=1 Tax=Rhizobium sp. 16-449-1b TaxID=2819989 RepID=UPI001ADA3271|nr:hypothetical protein [Rhizobium sp. 16-449-1b]MBO9196584.1 hypothetical protein [Rhizobium sp. 16-449-1b]
MIKGLRPLLLANLIALLGLAWTEARAEEAIAKQEDVKTTGTVPADISAPTDLWGEVNVLGTGPFWALSIREGQITFSRAGKNDVITINPGPMATTEDSATWTITHPPQHYTLTVTKETCVDGASAKRYDLAAKLVFQGRTLYGCAASVAALPAKPGP